MTAMSEDDLICLPCQHDGLTEPAFGYCQDCMDYMCETCFQYHRRSRPSRNHLLLKKENMPKDLTTMQSSYKIDFCSSHNDNKLEFYCTKHKSIACYVCITLCHKTCEVEYIPDISGNVSHSDEFMSLVKELRALKEKCETRIKQIEVANEQIDQDHAIVIEEIKLFRKQVNECLDKLEEEIARKTESLVRKEKHKMTNVKEACNVIIQEVNEKEASLVSLKDGEQHNKLFIEMKQSEESLLCLKSKEAKTQVDNEIHCGFKFVRNWWIINLLTAEKIGKVVLKDTEKTTGNEESNETNREESEHSNVPSEDKTVKLQMTGKIDVTSQGDNKESHICSIVLMPPKKIIVADFNNQSIKLTDRDKNSIVSQIKLSSAPFSITGLPQRKLAVALPNEKCIQMLSLSLFSLSTDRRLYVRESCRGLAYCNDKLIVACDGRPGKVIILNISGGVLKTFDSLELSLWPQNVVVSRDKKFICVSDYTHSKFIKIDWEGNVVKTFEGEKFAGLSGIQELYDGTFLLCHSDSSTIKRLSSSFQKCKITGLENETLCHPQAIAYCEKQQKLYVSYTTRTGWHNNAVKVFDVKWI